MHFNKVVSTIVFTACITALPAFAVCDPMISLTVDVKSADPVPVFAKATTDCPVAQIKVYLDGKLLYRQTGPDPINARLVMGVGTHRVVIQAFNTAGQMAQEVRYTTVTADPVEPLVGCDVNGLEGVEYRGDHIPYPAVNPIRVGMAAQFFGGVSSLRMYIDGVVRAQTFSKTGYCLSAALFTLKAGRHFINIEALDGNGRPAALTGSIVDVGP